MTRIPPALLLLLAFLAQALASPAGLAFTSWDAPSDTARVASCRCCDCGATACCAPAPQSGTPAPDPATPARGGGSDPLPLPDLPPRHPAFPSPPLFSLTGRPSPDAPSLPPPPAPSFLCGGGLLI
jgi:hypothetical protein